MSTSSLRSRSTCYICHRSDIWLAQKDFECINQTRWRITIFLFGSHLMPHNNYGDSSSIVFCSNFTLTGFNFIVTVCFPFLVASHGLSHRQAGLSHSRCRQHGSTAALSFPFGKAKVSQPQPRQVKPWQHYIEGLCRLCTNIIHVMTRKHRNLI